MSAGSSFELDGGNDFEVDALIDIVASCAKLPDQAVEVKVSADHELFTGLFGIPK